MVTTDDVNRMREENDVEGLIRILQSDIDPLLKWLAAKSLGDIGDPGDARVKTALQKSLTGDPMVAAGASSALAQLEANPIVGTRAQRKRGGSVQVKRAEKSAAQPQQKSGGCAASSWDLFRVFVVIVWVTVGFSLLMGMFEAVNSVEEMGGWGFIILFIVLFIGIFLVLSLGFRALYRFSSRRLRMAKGELPQE